MLTKKQKNTKQTKRTMRSLGASIKATPKELSITEKGKDYLAWCLSQTWMTDDKFGSFIAECSKLGIKKKIINRAPLNSELDRLYLKADSYNRQDIKKGRITYNFTYDCYSSKLKCEDLVDIINIEYELYGQLTCHYCSKYVYLIPTIKYDPKQLTFDRIDNYKSHVKDNLVICCYLCNEVRSNKWTSKQFLMNRANT